MTPLELARSCVEALSHPEREALGNGGIPCVGIAGSRGKVPLPKKSFPKWKHLANGPLGPVYYYPAKEVLRALFQHGLIDPADLAIQESNGEAA
jgi:hypothetical protein